MNTKLIAERRERTERLLAKLETKREEAIASLVATELKMKELSRQLRRYKKHQAEALTKTPGRPLCETISVEEVAAGLRQDDPKPEPEKKADDGIPPELRRTQRVFNPYAEEQAEARKAKSRARIEKMKAKQRGDLSKMPLQGKEALAAIRGGA